MLTRNSKASHLNPGKCHVKANLKCANYLWDSARYKIMLSQEGKQSCDDWHQPYYHLGEMPAHSSCCLQVPSLQLNSGCDIQRYKLCPQKYFCMEPLGYNVIRNLGRKGEWSGKWSGQWAAHLLAGVRRWWLEYRARCQEFVRSHKRGKWNYFPCATDPCDSI